MQSKPTYSLQKLLSLEDDDKLLLYYCSGTTLPAWSLIRVQFFRTIMSELLYTSGAQFGSGKRPAYLELIKILVRSQYHNIVECPAHDSNICFFTTGLGNYERNGVAQDRLVSYFADCHPSSHLIYQNHGGWRWRSNQKSKSILYAAPFNIFSQIMGRISVNAGHKNLATEVICLAAGNVKTRLDYTISEQKIEALVKTLSIQLAMFPIVTDYYSNWLAKRKVKLLFKEDACYGASSVAIIYAAKKGGVITAEYQHGAISKGHDGYNVAPALVKNIQYRQTLPDYLLTYGAWWSQQTNMPLKKVSIGNPHFTESSKRISHIPERKNQVLVLGDGVETEMYLKLASKVAKLHASGDVSVIFRPHPLEWDIVKSLKLPYGVDLDSNSDIYESFRQSSMVISELSTGLFEAAGIVKNVLLWKTDKSKFAFPDLPFPSFSTMQELEEHLQMDDNSSKHSLFSIEPDDLWAPNWELNYRHFVDSVLSI
jgi:hypothetical protein